MLSGCRGCAEPAEDAPLLCPREAGEIIGGDANEDGHADIADAVAILRARADAGTEPTCLDAVDLIDDEAVELDDAFSILIHLFEDGFSLPGDPGCEASGDWEPPECAAGAVALVVPGSAAGAFSAQVEIESDLSVEAWSLGVSAVGCQITAATTDDTTAEPIFRGGIGIRETGFDATFLGEDGATSGVVLGFMQPTALPAGEASVVLQLSVEPEDGACSCELTLTDGVATIGQPVDAILVAEGHAWPIEPVSVTVDTCGG